TVAAEEFRSDGAPLYTVLDRLSAYGKVRVRGLDYAVVKAIREELGGSGISGSLTGVRLDDALAALSVISGRRITARDAGDTVLTLEFRDATLRSLLKTIADQAGT